MSSPARSSVSATSAGHGGWSSGNACLGDDASPYHFPTDLISAHELKDEALAALKSELMAVLQREMKLMDEDKWMFSRPRSQINLISRPGGYQPVQADIQGERNHLQKQSMETQDT